MAKLVAFMVVKLGGLGEDFCGNVTGKWSLVGMPGGLFGLVSGGVLATGSTAQSHSPSKPQVIRLYISSMISLYTLKGYHNGRAGYYCFR